MTIGIAESSWPYHYDAYGALDWHHGDICEDTPQKNCFLWSDGSKPLLAVNFPFSLGSGCRLEQRREGEWQLHRAPLADTLYRGQDFAAARAAWAECTSAPLVLVTPNAPPQAPYLFTAYPLAIVALAALLPWLAIRLYKRRLTVAVGLGVAALPCLWQLLPAVTALARSWPALLLTVPFLASPVILVVAWRWEPAGRFRIFLRAVVVFGAAAFVPFLLLGPPSLLLLIFAPLLLPANALVTLGALKVLRALRSRIMR